MSGVFCCVAAYFSFLGFLTSFRLFWPFAIKASFLVTLVKE
jgi:hypothetical protein